RADCDGGRLRGRTGPRWRVRKRARQAARARRAGCHRDRRRPDVCGLGRRAADPGAGHDPGSGDRRRPAPYDLRMRFAEATTEQLLDWDQHTVDAPGGNVYQSRAWAEQRSRLGWGARGPGGGGGFRLPSPRRPWRLVAGAGAYLSKGPISGGERAERTAERLGAAADWLFSHGVDVLASDSEIPAGTGYRPVVEARGVCLV